MEKDYMQLANQDAGELCNKDLIALIASLYERLDQLDALE